MTEIEKAQRRFDKEFECLLKAQEHYATVLKEVQGSISNLYHVYLDNTNHSARSGDWLMQVQSAAQTVSDEVKYLDRYRQRLTVIQGQLVSKSSGDKTA